MNAVFMQLEDGAILNLVHVVEAYLSNGIYCVRTTSGIFPKVSLISKEFKI